MGYYGYGGPMMGWGGDGIAVLAFITWLAWTGVGILACIWLWKQITK